MRRPVVVVGLLVTCVVLFLSTVAQAASIEWTGDWEKVEGFYGPDIRLVRDVSIAKEAFGAASTLDEQITDTDKMPGIGKTDLLVGRNILMQNSYQAGA